jgi:methyl-accepting chemotaxis protein
MRIIGRESRIWMKLAVVALSFIVPLVVTTYFLVDEQDIKIQFAEQEMRGLRYLRPVSDLLAHVELHRAAVRREDAEQISRTETLVDADFEALLAVDADLRDELATTERSLNARDRGASQPARLQDAWESVKLSGSVAASEELHGQLVDDIRQLVVHVGDSSKLILDPDLDTYYVMDALLLREPELVDQIADLGDLIETVPATMTFEQQAELAGQLALFRAQVDGLETDLETAFAETPNYNDNDELEPTLDPLGTAALEVSRALADETEPSVDRASYAGAVREALDAHSVLWTALMDQEQKMLESRRDDDLGRRRFSLFAVFFVLILAAALTLWVARRLSRNVGVVATAAERVAGGDLGSRAPVTTTDEIGVMAGAFNTMAASLEELVGQVSRASEEVTSSATQLNSAAEELAATTTEQSAAVTQASATTEELARASASIADTVDEVAAQAAETRNNLEQAESDIDASSQLTLALAERVSQIGAILTLINEIADQTNLLALNAAIEAARAGEAGRGFSVVAEEVRRLAERSKSSAADIASIIEGIQSETNATVMAMEKGGKQMQAGLVLLSAAADGTAQVRLTTQQQRSATAQVVETMEQLSDASRQVSATASQIAAASAALARLAAGLEHTARSASVAE